MVFLGGPRQVGDQVYSFNILTGERTVDSVWTLLRVEGEPMTVVMSDGTRLQVTPEHPFFVAGIHQYVPIGNIAPGTEVVIFRNGVRSSLRVIEKVPGQDKVPVFNFGTIRNKNYFIDGILVHNHPKPIV